MDDAEFKKSVIKKINKARSDGFTFMEIENVCPEGISLLTVCGMLNAQSYPVEVWEAVDEALDKLEI